MAELRVVVRSGPYVERRSYTRPEHRPRMTRILTKRACFMCATERDTRRDILPTRATPWTEDKTSRDSRLLPASSRGTSCELPHVSGRSSLLRFRSRGLGALNRARKTDHACEPE